MGFTASLSYQVIIPTLEGIGEDVQESNQFLFLSYTFLQFKNGFISLMNIVRFFCKYYSEYLPHILKVGKPVRFASLEKTWVCLTYEVPLMSLQLTARHHIFTSWGVTHDYITLAKLLSSFWTQIPSLIDGDNEPDFVALSVIRWDNLYAPLGLITDSLQNPSVSTN